MIKAITELMKKSLELSMENIQLKQEIEKLKKEIADLQVKQMRRVEFVAEDKDGDGLYKVI